MKYIRKSDKQYPFSEFDIRALFPDTSFGYPFYPPSEFAEVVPKEPPGFDPYSQILIEKAPKLYRGVYSQQWEVQDLDPRTIEENANNRINSLKNEYLNAIQSHMDTTARTRGYDNIMSACSYFNSTVSKFKAEGRAATIWRDQVWAYCYAQLESMQDGVRPIPANIQSFIDELPKIDW